MKKPSILFLALRDYSGLGLEDNFEMDYYNYKMPTHVFFEKAKKADLIVEVEFNDCRSIYSMLVAQVNVKKAVWLIDTHCRPDHPEYAQYFDTVFISMKTMEYKFNVPIVHLPLAFQFHTDYIKTAPLEKREKIISFVGHINEYAGRREFFQLFENDLKKRNISYCFKRASSDEYAAIIQNSIIGFNKSQGNEVNYRVFENMGFGSLLLTDYNKEFDFITGLSERSFFYKNYEDVFNKIEQIKSEVPSYLENLIRDNQEWIKANHLFIHRILEIAKRTINYEPPL